ncbi:hypothetical protein XCR_1012 [Xanthomonas campestris pv. raphani 756C]|nr:hypothetical protein XCR_1012 [Xanthomonas campestris pv. raphani 756C]
MCQLRWPTAVAEDWFRAGARRRLQAHASRTGVGRVDAEVGNAIEW